MALERFENLDPERQETILTAAGREFAEHGYRAASVNRIIRASGISKGSLYYYFDDKADLFSTVVERAVARFMEETGWFSLEAVGAFEFWDTLLELSRDSVNRASRDDWWIQMGRAMHRFQAESKNQAAVARLVDLARGWWRAIIDRGQLLGVIRTDLPRDLLVEIALAADQGGDRWLMERWDELSPEEIGAIVDGRVDLLRDMLDKENEGWER